MRSGLNPPIYFIILLSLSIVLHFIFPLKKIIPTPYSYFGIVLIILGIIFDLWADFLFKKDKTTVKPYENPTQLEISGPFQISRHPMYLGMLLVLLGVAIFLGTVINFLFPSVFIIFMELFFIPQEEENLERIFGGEYLDYKKRVGRWV